MDASAGFARLMQQPAAAPNSFASLASPGLAGAWADAIMLYWRHGIESGAIDAGQTLYLVDLAPAQGQLAWRLLKALRAGLERRKLALNVCLVACCRSQEDADALLGHPCLSPFAAQGWLDAAPFDAGSDSALTLRSRKISLLAADNPMVLLALDHFSTLPSELMAVHYGELFGCAVAVHQAEGAAHLDLAYEWTRRPPEHGAAATPQAACVLDHYRTHFHSAALLLPEQAMATLQRLQRIAGGRYLLLAADAGVCDEQAIRLGAMAPPNQWHPGETQAPVNYHALSLAQRRDGALACNLQLEDGGIVMHAAWRAGAQAPDEDGMRQIAAVLEAAHPTHEQALRQLDGLNEKAFLALLHQSHHDPAMLAAAMDALSGVPFRLADCSHRAWRQALGRVWENFFPPRHCDRFAARMAWFAMQLGFLDIAQDCLRLALGFYGDDAYELYLLALCEARTGASHHALAHTRQALGLEPDYAPAVHLQAQLSEKLRRWQAHPAYLPQPPSAGALRIEPLGPEHAPDLLFQFRDQQIGVMTRLPPMESLQQAQDWIASERPEAGHYTFAAMHERWGFVGIVSCHCVRQSAYFYFWIGSDYQGRGFGQQAAKLLFAQLAAAGVERIYTSAEQVNHCSRHVLHKLGFEQMDCRPAPPDDSQYFYYLGDRRQPAILDDFLALCAELGNPVSLT
ncbi:GNAT family N-acetyltransferase [Massilia sp. SM-13]|uniref:GNAT family N-acetyltransferase n=1 Tax=Pseudoduganella rhizocola TaxID=3382643 RepID=UPI0038B56A01